jgi:hypothetical protein
MAPALDCGEKRFKCNYSGGDWKSPFGACGYWSAFADLLLAALPEVVSAQADNWREAPEEGDFNRLNSYV